MHAISRLRATRLLLAQERFQNMDQAREREILDAVLERFQAILPNLQPRSDEKNYEGGQKYLYDRVNAGESFAWRFLSAYGFVHSNSLTVGPEDRTLKPTMTPESIRAGQWDREIEAIWDDEAASEGWYAYEKQW